ncbi:MAG: ATP-binding protein [Gemmiger sp.]|uniref:ATP-binding protein n=1 Tax=Gemmiger sp. TaxID=2049027 RepID=UPI002E7A61E0|nr:ATP-binding protein [Gemmiger sp.]MEE0802030.1 ATP-binding protein [Gemmiger sp.]
MDIKRAKQEIEQAVKAYLATDDTGAPLIPAIRQRPILLMGPPGIGKTQIMEQVAQSCGIALVAYTITHHTRQSAVGLPFIRQRNFDGQDRSVTEYTMSEIIASVYDCMERTGLKNGILFIDEINCVSETLAPTMLQFLQCKTFGNQAVPAGWIIVAAGNPPEYNKSVREFDLVTLDRVRRIDIEPNLAVWQEYARAKRLHPAVQAYLELRPQHFYKIENDVDGPQFVTARGWEDLSAMLSACDTLNLPVDEGVIGQYLRHPEVSRDFAAYWVLYKKYREDYGIEDILQGRPFDKVLDRALQAAFDERISLVSLLLAGLNTRFAEARRIDQVTDACYQQLRAYKRTLNNTRPEEAADFGPAAIFAAQCNRYADQLAAGKAAGRLTDDEAATAARATKLLRSWAATLTPDMDADTAFDTIRAGFNAQVRKREDAVGLAGDALEYAFDFMERAFPDGQEMVVFVNELTLGPDSAAYLAENECERFESYSKKLLLHAGEDALLAELKRDDLRAGEHSTEF